MRRRVLIAAPLAVVLFAGLAVLSFAAGGGKSRPVKRNHFRTHELSFAYPASWRQKECNKGGTEFFDPIVYLGSASSPPRCTEEAWRGQPPLHRNGVIVRWGSYGNTRSISLSQFPGKRIRLGDQPARIAIQPPREGAVTEFCSKVAATRTMNVVIRFPQAMGSWYEMTACLRGPHLSMREAQIRRMLASVKLKAMSREVGICGTPSASVGRIVPDHATVKISSASTPVGPLVSVRLREPAKYLTGGYPQAFPWRMVTSSNPEVLDPRSFCHPRGTTSIQIATFASGSSSTTGRTYLHAALTPAWRALPPSARRGIAPYSSTVILTESHRRAASKR